VDYREDDGGTGDLGGLVRARRERAGLTQRELSVRAGLSVGAVRDIEQGRTAAPRSGSLARLAAALGLGEPELESRAAGPGSRRSRPPETPAGGLALGVLGPVAAWRDGARLSLGPVRQRAVLGLLALSQPAGLSRAALLDALWSADRPAAAVGMLQGYVARLRRALGLGPGGGSVLAWDGTGYRLEADGIRSDLAVFSELAARARRAAAAGDARRACGLYEQALRQWRGDPLADLDLLDGHPAVTDLARQRVAAVIEYADAASAAGIGGQAAEPLRALAARDPLDERVHARLMSALAAAGQQAAALRVYADLRLRLDQELGVRPGRELAEAHLRVLRQEVPAVPVTTFASRPRRWPAATGHWR
jgi:DNA-binding SARP family transcriptional activator